MIFSINRGLWASWAIFWTFLVIFSYWAFHPYYAVALAAWPNAGMVLALFLVSGGTWYILRKTKMAVAGWMIYLFLLLLMSVVYGSYAISQNLYPQGIAPRLIYFMGNSVLLHASFLIVLLFHYALGEGVLRAMEHQISPGSMPILRIATGISIFGLVLFFLGSVGWLKIWVLWPILLIVLFLQRGVVFTLLKRLFVKPISLKEETSWALIPLFMMLAGMAVALVGMVKLFPMGYDGAGLYMNTVHLISERGTLPRTGQSFNWELFLSLGEILFNRAGVAIFLSHGTIFLCLALLYQLGRLFLTRAAAWLALAMIFLNPAFSFHSMFDEKVDLGFLFIVLSALLLVLEVVSKQKENESSQSSEIQFGKWRIKGSFIFWGLVGWLCGYAFGVKYTGILAIVGLISLMGYYKAGFHTWAGMFLSAMGILFLAGINRFGYLDLEGTPKWIFSIICIVPGVTLLASSFLHNRTLLPYFAKHLTIFSIAAFIAFVPWMGKHLQEHKSFSISNLVQGKPRVISLEKNRILKDPRYQVIISKQILRKSILAMGVELTPEQENQIPNIMAQYTWNDPQGSDARMKQLTEARNKMITDVLNEQQRNQISVYMNRVGLNLDQYGGTDVQSTLDFIVKVLSKRGITLSEDQYNQLASLIESFMFEGKIQPGNTEVMRGVREEILDKILTQEQKNRRKGIQSGTYQLENEGNDYNAAFFGGVLREEVKRYIGYEPGLPLFLSMPYDITMNTSIPFLRYLDIGFLFMLLFPFLLYSKRLFVNIPIIAMILLVWTLSVYSLYVVGTEIPTEDKVTELLTVQQGNPPGIMAVGFKDLFEGVQTGFVAMGRSMHSLYASMAKISFIWIFIFLLCVALVLLALFWDKAKLLPRPLKAMLGFSFTFAFLWFFLGNAIVWYGFPFLSIIFLLFAWLYYHPNSFGEQGPTSFVTYWWRGVVGLYLIFSLSLFFVSGTQTQEQANKLYNSPFLNHASQNQDLKETYTQFMPYMNEAINTINADPKSKVYRVGTFFNYHIKNNDRRVLEDSQLGIYDQLMGNFIDDNTFVQVLKDNGFRYVLYGLNTVSMDRTPDKSLTRKANSFYLAISGSPNAVPLFTDNFVYDPAVPYTQVGKYRVPGKPGIGGQNTMNGTFILFELK